MAERTGSLILIVLWSYVEEWVGGGEYEVTKLSQQHQTIDRPTPSRLPLRRICP